MTTVIDATESATDAVDRQPGRVARVIGPGVAIEFGGNSLPALYNALTVQIDLGELSKTLTLEVAQHLGDDLVRAIALQPTDGLVRGAEVIDTGSPTIA